MRILQLIDSLEVGGAERIAVNYANALADRVDFSGIVATRKEGELRSRVYKNVFFVCLDKRVTFDFIAIFKLRSICKRNQIDWVHAHGTSYFTAFLLKLIHFKIKIIWHEHAGARSQERSMHNIVLWVIARFFCGIIVVNHDLELWCKTKLAFKQVIYLPNFTVFNGNELKNTSLHGVAGKRIVCLANLRHPKNHQLLLDVAIQFRASNPDWTFHFIGKDSNDNYSQELKSTISRHNLGEHVFIYDSCQDIDHILEQTTIGVLASSSEGLPLSLLEYGMHKKAVVVTHVGEMPLVVEDGLSGFVVPPDSVSLFSDALERLSKNESLRNNFGNALSMKIFKEHSENAVMAKYIYWLKHELIC